jgi:hypothetical protein
MIQVSKIVRRTRIIEKVGTILVSKILAEFRMPNNNQRKMEI